MGVGEGCEGWEGRTVGVGRREVGWAIGVWGGGIYMYSEVLTQSLLWYGPRNLVFNWYMTAIIIG